MSSESLNVLVCQISSGPNIADNISLAEKFLAQSKAYDLVIYPECALLWANKKITHRDAKTAGEWLALLSKLSVKYNTTIIWGGIAERDNKKVFNTSLVIDANGKLIAKYRKTHLFQIFADDKFSIDETDTYEYGDTGPVSIKIADWKIGISICYDLRFPEFYRNYTGCDLIINTAAFTRKTGQAHWEVLMRARAIENQCYMLGVGQCGQNKLTGIKAFGNSMLVDPWGELIYNLGEEVNAIVLQLNKESIVKARSLIPSLKSIRHEYSFNPNEKNQND